MHITYTGISDVRRITSADFPDVADDFEDLVWLPGQTIEVPDSIAERLLELDRSFKDRGDVTRDLRSKDELLALAQELKIPNRTRMNREELVQAITAAQDAMSVPDDGQSSAGAEPAS